MEKKPDRAGPSNTTNTSNLTGIVEVLAWKRLWSVQIDMKDFVGPDRMELRQPETGPTIMQPPNRMAWAPITPASNDSDEVQTVGGVVMMSCEQVRKR
jgi:hypothetical protein